MSPSAAIQHATPPRFGLGRMSLEESQAQPQRTISYTESTANDEALARTLQNEEHNRWQRNEEASARAVPRIEARAQRFTFTPEAQSSVTRPESGVQRDLEAGGDGILTMSCLDANLPPEIRLRFVMKVYALCGMMLLITCSIAAPFVFATDRTMSFMRQNMWLFYIVSVALLIQYFFNVFMMLESCCGGNNLITCYVKMFKTVPFNFIYITVFACLFGVVMGFVCASYTMESVLVVFAISFALILALTIYAIFTKADFTGMGPYVLVALLGLLSLLIIGFLFPVGSIFHRIIGGVGATIFGFIIVYDTQLIFGSATFGGERKYEYSLDMYAFAAYNLYLDFVNFFLYLLKLAGQRK